MATTSTTRAFNVVEAALSPLRALGSLLIWMAESSPRAQALDRLNRTSDDELMARGTTRVAEALRLLGSRGYL